MKKAYLLFVAIVISVCTSAQNGKNLIKPIDKDGFEVDSILSMRGDVIVYLRAGTEFDIKKSDVAYVNHSILGRIDIAEMDLPIPEPRHIGEAYMCNFDNKEYVQLEKTVGINKSKNQSLKSKKLVFAKTKSKDNTSYSNDQETVSALITQASDYSDIPKLKVYVDKKYSNLRAKLGEQKIIVRVPDQKADPHDIIFLAKFSVQKTRKLSLKKNKDVTRTGPYCLTEYQEVPFSAQKYGKSSFLITVDLTESGEYCILLNTVNIINDHCTLYCFGV